MKFTQFLKTKGAIATIFMGIFYAVAMLGIFLTGYSAIPANIDKLPIAIINDDSGEYGATITDQLQESLPFEEIETDITNKQALKDLEKNDLALVVHIPETFSEDFQKGDVSSSIDFTINEATATVVSSTMTTIVDEINNQLSTQFSQQTAQSILMNFNVPEDQATEMAEQIENSYSGNVVTINEVPDGMHNSMLPMFLTMAVYVGAMIGAMQLVDAFKSSRGKASKTRLFTYVQLTALLVAVVSTLVALGSVYLINDLSGDLFFNLAGQQILNYMVMFNFCAIFIFLVGEGGMIINMPILLAQTLANGATVTRDMMYVPFEWISYISPMYYSVQAHYATLFGSVSSMPYFWSSALIGGIALLINIIIVSLLHKPAEEKIIEKESEKNLADVAV